MKPRYGTYAVEVNTETTFSIHLDANSSEEAEQEATALVQDLTSELRDYLGERAPQSEVDVYVVAAEALPVTE